MWLAGWSRSSDLTSYQTIRRSTLAIESILHDGPGDRNSTEHILGILPDAGALTTFL
jgi:hypothetical protein